MGTAAQEVIERPVQIHKDEPEKPPERPMECPGDGTGQATRHWFIWEHSVPGVYDFVGARCQHCGQLKAERT